MPLLVCRPLFFFSLGRGIARFCAFVRRLNRFLRFKRPFNGKEKTTLRTTFCLRNAFTSLRCFSFDRENSGVVGIVGVCGRFVLSRIREG